MLYLIEKVIIYHISDGKIRNDRRIWMGYFLFALLVSFKDNAFSTPINHEAAVRKFLVRKISIALLRIMKNHNKKN
jgi:hypothetical protein